DLEKQPPVAVELPDALSRHGDVAVEVHRFVRGMREILVPLPLESRHLDIEGSGELTIAAEETRPGEFATGRCAAPPHFGAGAKVVGMISERRLHEERVSVIGDRV